MIWSSAIDLKWFILPVLATMCIAVGGVAMTAYLVPGDLVLHVVVAVLWLVIHTAIGQAFFTLRGIDGPGFGDVKLTAALCCWIGPADISAVLLFAALIGIAGILATGSGAMTTRRIAFGPAIALSLYGSPL